MSKLVNLGEQIKAARLALKLTQEQLAKACHVSRPAVAQWEKNTTTPSALNLYAISQATQLPLDFFFAQSTTTPLTQLMIRWLPVLDWPQLANLSLQTTNLRTLSQTLLPCPMTTTEQAFILLVNDVAMSPYYLVNDYIVVDPGVKPQNRDDVLVKLMTNQFVLRRYLTENGDFKLIAVNHQANAPTFHRADIVSLIGAVIFCGRRRIIQQPLF